MADEKVVIPLAIPSDFVSDTERQLDQMAQRIAQKFAQAFRTGGTTGPPGTAGSAGNAPGGGAFESGARQLGSALGAGAAGYVSPALSGVGGAVGGFAGSAALAGVTGFGAGIRNSPASVSSSPEVLAQNGLVNGVGSVLDKTVGQIPIFGDFIMGQFNSFKEAMEVPTERAAGRLRAVAGNIAAAGGQLSQEEMEQAAEFGIAVERRRYEGERNMDRVTREVAARDSLSQGLSWIGR